MHFSVAGTQYESDLFALATCSDSYRGKTTASMWCSYITCAPC